MKKTEKMYCFIQYPLLDTSKWREMLTDALTLGRILFNPLFIECDQQVYPFSLELLNDLLDNLTDERPFTIRIRDEWSETVLQKYDKVIFERHYFTKEQFHTNKSVLFDYVQIKMAEARFAYIRPYDEFLYHNIENLDYRQVIESAQAIQQHPKKKSSNGEIMIDGNYFSGYDVFYFGFCFTSCWRMYIGKEYREVMPLSIFSEVQQVEQVVELYPDIYMIELYKDPYAWENPSNQKFQQLFRDQIGIDQLSWVNGVGILREPMTEYRMAMDSLQIIQYQNDYLQPVVKNKATHFITHTYNLKTKKDFVQQMKGSLNAQAYFPLINDRKRRMKTIVTLMVGQTVDEGLSAYEFYIRKYLEANIVDKRYAGYTPVLAFFLPDSHFENIPVRQLKQRMRDVSFSEEITESGHKELVLSKGERRLQVEFSPLSFLKREKEPQKGIYSI